MNAEALLLEDPRAADEAADHAASAPSKHPLDIEAELATAAAELDQGLLHPAMLRVTAIIGQNAEHPPALALAGKIALFMRQPQVALAALQRAVALAPGAEPRIWLSLCLEQLGHPEESLEQLDAAIAALPPNAGAWFAVGLLHEKLSLYKKAGRVFLSALALDPCHVESHHHYGRTLHAEGQFEQAIEAYRSALRHADAKTYGNAKTGDAVANADRAGTIANLHIDLSSAFANVGQFHAARGHAEQAVARAPGSPEALNNLGHALLNLNCSLEAVAAYERAIAGRPDYAKAQFGLALALLKSGDFARGWPAYEWRWRDCQTPRAELAMPRWQGEPLAGRTLLLHAEQGFGDTLQFIRLAPRLAAAGARIILEVPQALVRLLRGVSGIAEIIARGEPLPPADLHCPLASLPAAIGLRPDTIPTQPYIRLPPEEAARQGAALRQQALGAASPERTGRNLSASLVVGLVWAGDPRPHDPGANLIDRRRSIPLPGLAPLFEVAGVKFVSLQLGKAWQDTGYENLIDGMQGVTDFLDTASRLAGVDLLISVDTSMVHLAGALGMPVWMLSRFDGCWRWLEDRSDSPWYPSLRIFRQPALGDWPGAIEAAAAALRAKVADRLVTMP